MRSKRRRHQLARLSSASTGPDSAATLREESDLKRQCMYVSSERESLKADTGGEIVEMSLALSPPGEKAENDVAVKSLGWGGEEHDHDDVEKCAAEMKETYLLMIMQRMVTQEVRNYVDSLRANGGHTFVLQSEAQQNDA